MVERRKQPTTASQYCVRGTDSLLYQREHLATRWDVAVARGVICMGKPTAQNPQFPLSRVPCRTVGLSGTVCLYIL